MAPQAALPAAHHGSPAMSISRLYAYAMKTSSRTTWPQFRAITWSRNTSLIVENAVSADDLRP